MYIGGNFKKTKAVDEFCNILRHLKKNIFHKMLLKILSQNTQACEKDNNNKINKCCQGLFKKKKGNQQKKSLKVIQNLS